MLKRLLLLLLPCLLFCDRANAADINCTLKNNTHLIREVTITATNTVLCSGNVELSTSSTGIFQWQIDDVDIPNAKASKYKPTTIGRYRLKVVDGNGTEELSNEIVIVAGTAPTVSFTSTATGNQCGNEEISFTSTTGTGISYEWNFGDPNSGVNNNSSEANPKHVFFGTKGGGTNTFTVQLRVTNEEGCVSSLFSATVTTKQIPDLSFTDADSFFPFSNCHKNPTVANPNYTIKVNNASSNQATISTYTIDWADGTVENGLTNSSFPISHTYTKLGAFEMKITATGANGCSNIWNQTVANQSNPAGGLGTLGNTSALCAPADVPFVISNWQNNSVGTVYYLDFGDGTNVTLTHPLNLTNEDYKINHTYNTSSCPALSFTARLYVSNACSETPFAAGNIQIWIKPSANFTTNPLSSCLGKSVSFVNTTKKGTFGNNCSDQTTYSWDFGDPTSTTNTSSSENPSHIFATEGTYTVTLTATNPCGTTTKTLQVCVNPLPVSGFTTPEDVGCAPFSLKATNTSAAPNCGTNTYAWAVTFTGPASQCTPVAAAPVYINSTSATSANPEFRFDRAGTYTISLVTRNSEGTCTSSAFTKIITVKAKPVVTLPAMSAPCAGVAINPTATVLNCYSSTVETYLWKFPGSNTPTSTSKVPGPIVYPTGGSYAVTLEVTNECGTTTVTTNTFVVNELPIVNAINSFTLCRGTVNPAIIPMSNVAGVTYDWTNGNTAIGLAASGTNNTGIPQFTAANTTNAAISATITVTPKKNGCSGTPITFQITVNPSSATAAAGPDQKLCEVTTTTLAGNDPGATAGEWTIVSGTGITLDDKTKFNTGLSGLQNGRSYELKWTISGFGNCPATADNVVISVAPQTVAGVTNGARSFCGGSNSGSVNITGQVGVVVNWERSIDGTNWTTINNTSTTYNYTAITANTQFRARIQSGACTALFSDPAIITVTPIPVAPTTVTALIYCLGETAPVLAATGTSLKWYSTVPPSVNFATDAPIPSTTTAGTFTYFVTQTTNGCESPYRTITVTVNASIVNNNVRTDQTICKGGTPTLLNSQSGAPTGGNGVYTYQWQESTDGTNFTAVTGANQASFQPPFLLDDRYYKRIVNSAQCSVGSNIVKITVQGSLTNTQISIAQTICNGTAPSLIVGEIPIGGSGTYIYSWEKSVTSATAEFTAITGEIGADYQPGTLTQTTYFRRRVVSGSCNVISNAVEIYVNPIPVMTPVTEVIYCNGASTSLIAFNSNQTATKMSYSWTNDNGNIGLATSGTGNLPVFTTQNNTKAPIEAIISVTPIFTDRGKSCEGIPVTFKIMVLPTIAPVTIAATTVCSQTNVLAVTLANDASPVSGSAVSYSWTVSGDQIGLAAGRGSQIPAFTAINNGTTNLTAVVTVALIYTYKGTTCDGNVATYQITVNAAPNVNFSIPNQTICNETATAEVALTSATTGSNISWTAQAVYGISGLVTAGTDKIPTQTLINTTQQPIVVTYKAIASTSGSTQCDGAFSTYTITVNPSTKAKVNTTANTICSQGKTGITISSTTPGTVFEWIVANNPAITGAVNGTGNAIDQTLTNNTAIAQLVNYTVTPTFSLNGVKCSGDPVIVAITVNPSPKVDFSEKDQVVCSGTTIGSIQLSSTTLNANISWTSVVPSEITGTISSNGTTTINTQTLRNTGNTPLTIIYRAVAKTPDANACDGAVFDFKITVNPVPVVTNAVLSQDVCSGGVSKIVSLTANVAQTTFRWTAVASSTNLAGFIASGTGEVPSQTIFNSGTTVEKIRYTIVPTANGCDGPAVVYEINAYPAPILSSDLTTETICNKTAFKYVPQSPTAGVTFKWTRVFINGISNAAASGSGVDALGAINETLANTTINPIEVTYRYELTINGCTSATLYAVKVIVNPPPTASFAPVSQNGCAPFNLVVKNLNSRTSVNTYTADFGDGSPMETFYDESDIKHTYESLSSVNKTFNLKMTTKNACGEVTSITYVIIVQPQSVYSKLVLQGSDRYGCAPFFIDFTKLNQSAGGNLYRWDFGDGSQIQEAHSIDEKITHTYLAAGDYTVKLTASNGCSTVLSEQLITVYPNVTASFNADRVQSCIGEEIKLTNTSDPRFTSLWDFGDGKTSTDVNPTHVYLISGVKTITLRATKIYPTGGSCEAVAVKTVNVLVAPDATFTTNAQVLNCGPFKLTAKSNSADAINVQWDFGDPTSSGNAAVGLNADHTYNKAGSYTITSTAYNLLGCTMVSTQIVKITEAPIAKFTFSEKNICGRTATVAFTNTSSYNGVDPVLYKWYVNDILTSNAKDFVHSFNVSDAIALPYIYRIRLESTNIIGCGTTQEQFIQFNPIPEAGFAMAKIIDCTPFRPAIVNTSKFGNQYEWFIDDVRISTAQVPENLVFTDPDKTYTLKLVVSNQWGCLQGITTKTVGTYPNPKADFSVKNDIGCNGVLDVEITNKSIGATILTWDYGDGSTPYVGTAPKHLYPKAGVYELKLTASNGFCSDVHSIIIQVADAPKAAFLSDVQRGCTQLYVKFENKSINATEYIWDFGDGTFSGETVPFHRYVFRKTPYTVKLIAKNAIGCSNEMEALDYIFVYPPPSATIEIMPNKIIKVPNYTFTFKAESPENIINYKWDFGDGTFSDRQTVTHKYVEAGTYKIKLTITNIGNCESMHFDEVQVLDVPGYLYLPNAFEPSSQKLELQQFRLKGAGMSAYNFQIFNKWGQVVFATNKLDDQGAPLEFWDGKLNGVMQPQGAYYWKAEAQFINGKEWRGMRYNDGVEARSGVIHLIK